MFTTRFFPVVPIALAAVILFILSWQYPFSTTFPIGGDASFYVKRAQTILAVTENPVQAIEALRGSWYPLSLVVFSTAAIFPVDWPTRFVWYMTASHIITGLILARLLYRISGWRASALVMIIWAITTTGITTHVQDGTLAHLMSFMFLALFLERISAGASWTALGALIATILTHPVNGLGILVAVVIATPIILASWSTLTSKGKRQLLIICPANAVLLILVIFAGKPVFANISIITGVSDVPFIDMLVSRFSPFVALAPLGLLALFNSNKAPILKFIIASLFSLSAIMAGNDLLGISVWSDRLSSLFVFTVTILAAIGLSYIIQGVFTSTVTKTLFVVVFVFLISVSAWRSNMHVFEFYENTDNYARLHPDELAAIYWMRDNLVVSDSSIVTIHKNRHAEWIPALTSLKWFPVLENEFYFDQTDNTSGRLPADGKQRYVTFFTLRQNITEKYTQNPGRYPNVFSNKAVSIFKYPVSLQ